jgi:hypothetical protein
MVFEYKLKWYGQNCILSKSPTLFGGNAESLEKALGQDSKQLPHGTHEKSEMLSLEQSC